MALIDIHIWQEKSLLLRLFAEGVYGYSECRPWPLLGDAPISQQVKLLQKGQPTALMQRALQIAEIDRKARLEGVSLFKGLTIPESHYLLPKPLLEEALLAEEEGFSRIKIKMGPEFFIHILEQIVQKTSLQLRLDFNSSLSAEEFKKFCELSFPWERIEFIEDPTPISTIWQEAPMPLACDFEPSREDTFYQYRILKPLREEYKATGKKEVITSSWGHPLGDVIAAYFAAKETTLPGGWMTYQRLKADPFAESLIRKGPFLKAPEGTGFGFDHLLENLSWVHAVVDGN